jgi:hypothetical protein
MIVFLLVQVGPATLADGSGNPVPDALLYLEPGPKIVENDGSQSMIVSLRQKGSMNIDGLDPKSIRATIFDPDKRQTLPVTFQYRNGNIETRISSRKNQRLFIQTCQKTQTDGKTILKGCAATVYLRGYSSGLLRALLKRKKTITNQGPMPLTLETVDHNYWPKVEDPVTIAAAFKGNPMEGQEIFVEAPGDIRDSYTTDRLGRASFAIPSIENSRFNYRFAGLPLIVWTQSTDPQNQTAYVSSLTIDVHPRFYDGNNYRDARPLVFGLMSAFTVIFLLIRVNKRRHEDY